MGFFPSLFDFFFSITKANLILNPPILTAVRAMGEEVVFDGNSSVSFTPNLPSLGVGGGDFITEYNDAYASKDLVQEKTSLKEVKTERKDSYYTVEDRRGRTGYIESRSENKDAEEYATVDDMRDMACHTEVRNIHSGLPRQEVYKGVPNHSKNTGKVCIRVCYIVIAIFQVFLLALGLYNFYRASNNLSTTYSISELTAGFSQTKIKLDAFHQSSDAYFTSHNSNLDSFSAQLDLLNGTVHNLTSSLTSETPSANVSIDVCSTLSRFVRLNYITASPNFTSGTTVQYAHSDASTYVANVFCAVDDSTWVFPIAATPVNDGTGWSCRCHVLVLQNDQNMEPLTFRNIIKCFMYATICPKIIPIEL